MDMECLWNTFIRKVEGLEDVESARKENMAGIPFLFIKPVRNGSRFRIEKGIRLCASETMKGKMLRSETVFVRTAPDCLVYRHRFYVPQQKMFCCGNLCLDCIRLNPNSLF